MNGFVTLGQLIVSSNASKWVLSKILYKYWLITFNINLNTASALLISGKSKEIREEIGNE